LSPWAGWLVDYDRPTYLIAKKSDCSVAVRIMREIGIDNIAGIFDAEAILTSGLKLESFPEKTPQEIASQIENGEVSLIDVRGDGEWNEGHILQAQRCFLANVSESVARLSGPRNLVFQCRSGGRSSIAASLAQAAGVKNVINLKGGIGAWIAAGLPVVKPTVEIDGPTCRQPTCAAEPNQQGALR